MGVRKMSLEQQQQEETQSKVTNQYRVEITEFQEDSEESEVDETVTRIVHWPPPPPSPKEGEFVQKLESNTKAKAKYSKFNMEEEADHVLVGGCLDRIWEARIDQALAP